MSPTVLGYVVVIAREGVHFLERFWVADVADQVGARQRARDAARRLTEHGSPGERIQVCAIVAEGAEASDLRAECDRLHDLAGQRALERDSAAQSARTWEAACKEARDERDRLRAGAQLPEKKKN